MPEQTEHLRKLETKMRAALAEARRAVDTRTEPTVEGWQTIADGTTAARQHAEIARDTKMFAELGAALKSWHDAESPDYYGGTGAGSRLSLKATRTVADIAGKMVRGYDPGAPAEVNAKALMPSGTVTTDVVMVPAEPVQIGRVVSGLTPFLPVALGSGPNVSYLRQTTRTNNAAPVATGGLKPTSVYGLDRVQDRLRVVAHLSEPIDRYWLEDAPALRQFVADEMLYGLNLALEAQIVSGDGLGENLTGLLSTSGIQAQAFVDNASRTLRAAQTKLETQGAEQLVFALNPADLEIIDTLRADTGGTSGPYLHWAASIGADQSDDGLWRAAVARTTAVPAGTGIAFDPSALLLYVDAGIRTEWSSETSDDFARNQLRARTEGRFFFAVLRPSQVVSVDLTAA